MIAVYKKELKAYFTSMIGCVFIAFCLIITGFWFGLINVYASYPIISAGLKYVVSWFLPVLIPVLTMRIISEERHNKTDQLLYTAPVSVYSIVIGKYLALLTIYAIPVLIECLYPVILSQYGEVFYATEYLTILSYFLIGASFIAIGMFISSTTESQIIAAIVSIAILYASYFMSTIVNLISGMAYTSLIGLIILIAVLCIIYFLLAKNVMVSVISFITLTAVTVVYYIINPSSFEGVINAVLKNFCLIAMADNMFTYGILDISAIVYYITVITFFVFITVQSIQKKRWN